ncbi:MAG TPA: metallophosphoesterase family protein [Roseiflexaceae bacterium]|nr:metallophosphoesterase family protein [Roseiflexaceae bacterium]
MRIAVLADIHGNLAAFEAVLAHLATQAVDQIVIGGDVVNGSPDSQACWQLAVSLGCPILRGNHERYVAHYGTPHAHPSWESLQYGPVHWSAAQCTPAERASMEALPLHLTLPGAPDLLIVHASPRSDHDTIAPYTPDAEMAAMFGQTVQRTILRGHNHTAQTRLWNGYRIVTTGSVGLPLDGWVYAQYTILEWRNAAWHIQHQAVPYDVGATVRRFHETGYLNVAGPIGHLFLREVATGAHHLVPFLRAYQHWNAAAPISLEAALSRFLGSME